MSESTALNSDEGFFFQEITENQVALKQQGNGWNDVYSND